ncbi:hypothetical protein [Sphingobium sp. BS19]|uniref:hypothetical protein n=1 Tax=Sphingobium sp. BS19 TaxID=3018973 RepID=UPI0022EDAAF4|nr:hypothetical protein [Sphingobium sp. BS19]GLI97041.1 hypothetical protein Sbs19_08590 [Sphingobium sp. BS19]
MFCDEQITRLPTSAQCDDTRYEVPSTAVVKSDGEYTVRQAHSKRIVLLELRDGFSCTFAFFGKRPPSANCCRQSIVTLPYKMRELNRRAALFNGG